MTDHRALGSAPLLRAALGAHLAFVLVAFAPVASCSSPPTPSIASTPPATVAPTARAHGATGFLRYPTLSERNHEDQINQIIEASTGCVGVTESGERILSKGRVCEAPWIGAVERLPPLTAVARSTNGYLFLSREGRVFESATPLGETTEIIANRTPRIGLVGAMVSADTRGMLSHFDGAHWQPARGLGGVPTLGFSASPFGLFAVGAPESLWESTDGGASFVEIGSRKVAPIGAHAVAYDTTSHRVEVRGLLGCISRDAGSDFAKAQCAAGNVPYASLGYAPHPTLLGRTAALFGDRYTEIVRETDGPPHWVLVSGNLGQPLAAQPMPELERCEQVSIASRGDTLVIACEDATETTLLASRDGGKRLDEWARLDAKDHHDVTLTLLDEHTVLTVSDRARRYAIVGPGSVRESGPWTHSERVANHLSRLAYFDSDGPLRVTMSQWGPDGLLASAAPIEVRGAIDATVGASAFDDDGTLGFSAVYDGRTHWVTISTNGAVHDVAVGASDQLVGGAGERVVLRRDEKLVVSTDGGASFDALASNPDVGAVACEASACLFDQGLVWLPVTGARAPVLSVEARADEPTTRPVLGRPITCSVVRSAKPKRFDDIETYYRPFPRLGSAGRDDALFSLSRAGKRLFARLDDPSLALESGPKPPIEREPHHTLGTDLSPPPFAARLSTSAHERVDHSLAEIALITFSTSSETNALRRLDALQYAWVDSVGATHAETLSAFTVGQFTRRGAEAGVLLAAFDPTSIHQSWSDASFRAILESGALSPPTEVPTPDDFARSPRKCTKADRANTARLEYEYGHPVSGGGRSPVVLASDSSGWGLVDGWVLFGTKDAPCAAAVRASVPGGVLMLEGSLTHGLFFRASFPEPEAGKLATSVTSTSVSIVEVRCDSHERTDVPAELADEASSKSSTMLVYRPGKQ